MYGKKLILFVFGTAVYFDLYVTQSDSLEADDERVAEHHGISSPLSEAVSSGRSTDEERLLRSILKLYDAAARPVYNASHAVTVEFGINLIQIQKMVRHQICIIM
jgi:hypothetical protein